MGHRQPWLARSLDQVNNANVGEGVQNWGQNKTLNSRISLTNNLASLCSLILVKTLHAFISFKEKTLKIYNSDQIALISNC